MIGLIGLNHNTASIQVREGFAFSPEEATRFIRHIVNMGLARGGVLLSTCNRIELYFHSNVSCHSRAIAREMAMHKGQSLDDKQIYMMADREVERHLFGLGAGLHSMVVGETQILGQIKEAFKQSKEAGLSTPLMIRLFDRAFETAKAVRSSCFISAIPISAGAAAVDCICQRPEINTDSSFLVLGAGQMADTIVEALLTKGYDHIGIYNRTRSRAERLADRYGQIGIFADEELPAALASADVVFVATSSATPIITPDLLYHTTSLWGVVPHTFFDMAVPRNVDPIVIQKNNVQVLTIDDLRQESDTLLDRHGAQTEQASILIEEAVDAFGAWREQEYLREVIGIVQRHYHELLERDLNLLKKTHTAEELNLIRPAIEHLRTTIATDLVSRLRIATERSEGHAAADLIATLFKHRQ